MRKKDFIFELVISCINLCLLLPLLILMIQYYDNPCNFAVTSIIFYFFSLLLFAILEKIFPNSSILSSNFFRGFKFIFVNFIINTILLLKLLHSKKEKNGFYWITLGIVIVTYLVMIIFVLFYTNIDSCNMMR